MNIRHLLLGCVCVLSNTWLPESHGSDPPQDQVLIDGELVDKKTAVFVYDLANHRFGEPENKAPLKYKARIYVRWHPELERWLPDLVLDNGYFSDPDRFILPGSVVPGEWLGMHAETRFEFFKNKPNLTAWHRRTSSDF